MDAKGMTGRTLYMNKTAERICLAIGERPGQPWPRYDADPGEIVEGSAAPAYREKFLRAGFTEVTAEEAELEREIAKEEAAKAKAVEPAPVADPPPAPPAPAAQPVPAPAVTQPRGKRGSDRNAKS